jgi:phosphopantetheinyl transferase
MLGSDVRRALWPFLEAARIYRLYEGPPSFNGRWDGDRVMFSASHGDDYVGVTVRDFRRLVEVVGGFDDHERVCLGCVDCDGGTL